MQVSLLMANGHTNAGRYTPGRIWVEAEFVVERHDRALASEMILIQLAVSSVMSKKSGAEFAKRIKALMET